MEDSFKVNDNYYLVPITIKIIVSWAPGSLKFQKISKDLGSRISEAIWEIYSKSFTLTSEWTVGHVKSAFKDPSFAQIRCAIFQIGLFRPLTTCSATWHFKFKQLRAPCCTKLHLWHPLMDRPWNRKQRMKKIKLVKSAIPSSFETFFPTITCSTNFFQQQPGS